MQRSAEFYCVRFAASKISVQEWAIEDYVGKYYIIANKTIVYCCKVDGRCLRLIELKSGSKSTMSMAKASRFKWYIAPKVSKVVYYRGNKHDTVAKLNDTYIAYSGIIWLTIPVKDAVHSVACDEHDYSDVNIQSLARDRTHRAEQYVTRKDSGHIWRVKYIKGDMFHGRNAGGYRMDLYMKDYRPATNEEVRQYLAFGTKVLAQWRYVHDRSTRTTWEIQCSMDDYCTVTDRHGGSDQLLWDTLRCATPIEIKQFKRG